MEAEMCSCDFDDARPLSPCAVKIVKARKEHMCDECEETIKPGEQYESIRGKCEEGWIEHKTCIPCQRIRKNFCAPLGCLKDELEAALGFNYVTGEWDPNHGKSLLQLAEEARERAAEKEVPFAP